MEKLIRTEAPANKDISGVDFIKPKYLQLRNGVKVYYFDNGEQEVAKVELNFKSGTKYHQNPIVAQFAIKLMTEGTENNTSSEIAEKLDFIGAHLITDFDKDYASVSLVSLTKHLETGLSVMKDVVTKAIFPQHEIDVLMNKVKSEFEINNMKVAYLSRKYFGEKLFGVDHYYGKSVYIADFESVDRVSIIDFYNSNIKGCSFEVFISGKITSEIIAMINQFLGNIELKYPGNKNEISAPRPVMGYHFFEKADALQNAIRIGKLWVEKGDADWHGLRILNVILGGYFGSRLMKNIREDKGLTYGIGSGIGNLEEVNYFFISTEVKSEMTQLAINEIRHEIEVLQTQLVDKDELNLVKSYIQGSFRRSFDGPFSMIERFKSLHLSGLDYDFYRNYIEIVKSITPVELRNLAQKHLEFDSLLTVVVGSGN